MVFFYEYGIAKDMSTHSPNSSPIVLSVWCLACVVLVYLYTGVLISYLTIPKMRPIVETVEELAESTRLQVVAIKNSIFESTLLVSSELFSSNSFVYLKLISFAFY